MTVIPFQAEHGARRARDHGPVPQIYQVQARHPGLWDLAAAPSCRSVRTFRTHGEHMRTLRTTLVAVAVALGVAFAGATPASAATNPGNPAPAVQCVRQWNGSMNCAKRDFANTMVLPMLMARNHPSAATRINAGEVLASLYGPSLSDGSKMTLAPALRTLIWSTQTGKKPNGGAMNATAYGCIANEVSNFSQEVYTYSDATAYVTRLFKVASTVTDRVGVVAEPLKMWAGAYFDGGQQAAAAVKRVAIKTRARQGVDWMVNICLDGTSAY